MDQVQETPQERKTRLARIRQARWYAKNAEKKKEKQKDKYVPKENPKKSGRPKKEVAEIIIPEPVSITRNTSFTQDEIISIIMNDENITSNDTKKTMVSDTKRFFNNAECSSLRCLKSDYKLAIGRVEDGFVSKGKNIGSNFSAGTLRSTFTTLATIIERYVGNFIPKKALKFIQDKIKAYKSQATDEYIEKQEIVYPTFSTYKNKVELMYGKESKEYLITSLYQTFAVRDNYGGIPILKKPPTTLKKVKNSDTPNFIVVKKNYSYIVLSNYKTSDQYDTLRLTLPYSVNRLMKEYIANNNIQFGEPLFPEEKLSTFVSNMNNEIGYGNLAGINAYRHMRVSELDGSSYADKVELANTMGHSVLTQKLYRKNLEVLT
jgi:hypothetical protein